MVPEDATVDKIPPQLFGEERRILAASRIDDYERTRAELAHNRARWVSGRTAGKRSQASGLSVEQLFDDLLVLLDGEPLEDAPTPDSILTAHDRGMELTRGLPTWAQLEAQNHRS